VHGVSRVITLRDIGVTLSNEDRFTRQRMVSGALSIFLDGCVEAQSIHAVLGAGGSGNTHMVANATQALPIGFPKLILTTLASGWTDDIIGMTDLLLIPSVCDIDRPHSFIVPLLANTAATAAALAKTQHLRFAASTVSRRSMCGTSMLGSTTTLVQKVARGLATKKIEVVAFHAVGSGGKALCAAAKTGAFSVVVDLSINEIAAHLCGSHLGVADRLTSIVDAKVPQVLVPGAAETVLFARGDSVPKQLGSVVDIGLGMRAARISWPLLCRVADAIVESARRAFARQVILLPELGLSNFDGDGRPFNLGAERLLFFDRIEGGLSDVPHVSVSRYNYHALDDDFAEVVLHQISPLITCGNE
jgi:uncharacterized protein (UPF0261 family)